MPEPNEEKIVFDEKQQQKVNQLISEAQGRRASEVRAELAATKAAQAQLQAELDAAQAALRRAKTPEQKDEVARLLAQIDEMKTASSTEKAELDAAKAKTKAALDEEAAAKATVANTQKINSIQAVAARVGFYDPAVVATLTKDLVTLDPNGNATIMNENGTPRLNASMDPMTLEEFYTEYATKNPYMVKGEVRPGTGAFEARRTIQTDKYKLEDLFGPKSNGALVNNLAKTNNRLYKELRIKAVAAGLVL